jgi:phage shock protein C
MKEKLYRSKKNKMLFGVCAGLADFFEIDPTIVRIIAAALLIFTNGFAVPLYIILAIVVPENPNEKASPSNVKTANNSYALGAGLVVIGAIMLMDSYGIVRWDSLWPAILIIIGGFLIWGKKKK